VSPWTRSALVEEERHVELHELLDVSTICSMTVGSRLVVSMSSSWRSIEDLGLAT
jgi:hypothetical protein